MARPRKSKPGDTRRNEADELEIAVPETECLGPAFLKCKQIRHPGYMVFFQMCDAFFASGAQCITCPTCGLHSVWNFRVDRKPTKEAARYLKALKE